MHCGVFHGVRVLWVDDRPNNNVFERRAMQALGHNFEMAQDTTDAIQKLNDGDFDLVISDMSRPSGDKAGFELLSAVRKEWPSLPVIFYTEQVRREKERQLVMVRRDTPATQGSWSTW